MAPRFWPIRDQSHPGACSGCGKRSAACRYFVSPVSSASRHHEIRDLRLSRQTSASVPAGASRLTAVRGYPAMKLEEVEQCMPRFLRGTGVARLGRAVWPPCQQAFDDVANRVRGGRLGGRETRGRETSLRAAVARRSSRTPGVPPPRIARRPSVGQAHERCRHPRVVRVRDAVEFALRTQMPLESCSWSNQSPDSRASAVQVAAPASGPDARASAHHPSTTCAVLNTLAPRSLGMPDCFRQIAPPASRVCASQPHSPARPPLQGPDHPQRAIVQQSRDQISLLISGYGAAHPLVTCSVDDAPSPPPPSIARWIHSMIARAQTSRSASLTPGDRYAPSRPRRASVPRTCGRAREPLA